MSDRLFRTKGELRKALQTDLEDVKKMKRHGEDTSGISQVIKHKKILLKDKNYWKD